MQEELERRIRQHIGDLVVANIALKLQADMLKAEAERQGDGVAAPTKGKKP